MVSRTTIRLGSSAQDGLKVPATENIVAPMGTPAIRLKTKRRTYCVIQFGIIGQSKPFSPVSGTQVLP